MVEPFVDPGYQAALTNVALFDEFSAGRIFMRGRDRASLLHRLSTNQIERLQPGQGTRTVLTTPIGRIIDLLTVHVLDDALLLITSPGQGGLTYSHLRKNIFFNDQVTLEAAGRSHGQLVLFGPHATQLLEQVSGTSLAGLPRHHIATVTIAEIPLLAARREPIGGDGLTLYIPIEHLEPVREALYQGTTVTLTSEVYDILRVEQGYGAFGHELSQEYIPLETGLIDAISFTKGCYVGQEIIARMESRNRLAKQLRGLRLSAPVAAPKQLEVDGKQAGELTSSVISPRFGPIALGYIRAAHAAPGTIVEVCDSNTSAEVIEVPFL